MCQIKSSISEFFSGDHHVLTLSSFRDNRFRKKIQIILLTLPTPMVQTFFQSFLGRDDEISDDVENPRDNFLKEALTQS